MGFLKNRFLPVTIMSLPFVAPTPTPNASPGLVTSSSAINDDDILSYKVSDLKQVAKQLDIGSMQYTK